MMTIVAADPVQQAEQIRQATEEARRLAARIQQATEEPEQQREWIRQRNVIYGGLIAIGLVLVQPASGTSCGPPGWGSWSAASWR